MKVIANGQTYNNSTWLPGKDGIFIGGSVGVEPVFVKNIPSTVKNRVYEKLAEQKEKHPDYVNVDEALDEACNEEYENA